MSGIRDISHTNDVAPKKKFWRVNWHVIRKNVFTTVLKEAPCLGLAVVGATIGMGILAHNPRIELGIAILGAIVGETIAHKILKPSCHDRHDCSKHAPQSWRHEMVKRYSLALIFGILTWGGHQYLLHDTQDAQNHTYHAPLVQETQAVDHVH